MMNNNNNSSEGFYFTTAGGGGGAITNANTSNTGVIDLEYQPNAAYYNNNENKNHNEIIDVPPPPPPPARVHVAQVHVAVATAAAMTKNNSPFSVASTKSPGPDREREGEGVRVEKEAETIHHSKKQQQQQGGVGVGVGDSSSSISGNEVASISESTTANNNDKSSITSGVAVPLETLSSSVDEKVTLPSIKATQKDLTKNYSVLEQEHKVQILTEILKLVVQTKCSEGDRNNYRQWSIVQDYLEVNHLGRYYRRMDKPYCFKVKILNAVESWVDWAKRRGYPSPETIMVQQQQQGIGNVNNFEKFNFPKFLELVYKVYIDKKERGSVNGGSITNATEDVGTPSNDNNNSSSMGSLSPASSSRKKHSMSYSTSSQKRIRMSDDTSDLLQQQQSNDGVVNNNTTLLPNSNTNTGPNIVISDSIYHSPEIKNYLKSLTLYHESHAQFLKLKSESLQADLDDKDMERLEKLESKIRMCEKGSLLQEHYNKLKRRCLDRLGSSRS